MRRNMAVLLSLALLSVGCGSDTSSISVLPDSDTFQQATLEGAKVDLLWMIDNSGSMQTSQENLRDNFPVFISDFLQLRMDFQIAVATTDAFLALDSMAALHQQYAGNAFFEGLPPANKAKFRDGANGAGLSHSGVFVINPTTPNIETVFGVNALQGTYGYGDERPLQSMKTALDSSLNPAFVRPNSHLAVIILTDEDDFSHDGTSYLNGQYTNPALHTPQSYVDYLTTKTNSSATRRRFSVHSISVKDQACLNQLGQGRRIATRVLNLVDAVGNGVKANLCGNFATELRGISERIVQLSTKFFLSRIPVPSTIQVLVNGTLVPTSGWVYDDVENAIIFNPGFTPAEGATIRVTFDPVNLG